jgi:hypothetical protein
MRDALGSFWVAAVSASALLSFACGNSRATFDLEGKAGECDLDRSRQVVPFARSEAEQVLCSPEERDAMAQLEGCLDQLPVCSREERAWTREVERCLSLAAAVSDGCLGAFVGPPMSAQP